MPFDADEHFHDFLEYIRETWLIHVGFDRLSCMCVDNIVGGEGGGIVAGNIMGIMNENGIPVINAQLDIQIRREIIDLLDVHGNIPVHPELYPFHFFHMLILT